MIFWSFPPTRKQIVVSVTFFVVGALLFSGGAYLSLVNIGPQQARAKARSDYVKARLRKWLDD
ncbi:PREDICTED: uncharacterized protein LOC104809965 [Tarenaya hassleriana]|uniref:uncharacterized protein LOC104809965 n=1 Tax=Tarenaya hassleriana TaxID=28532 RepID=UPI00053C7E6D|nr:PREDICTED: uncharacterized protein LOC104809965 [Tarenaya hassleriana]